MFSSMPTINCKSSELRLGNQTNLHTVPNVCYAGQNRAKSVNQVGEAEKAMLLVGGVNADRAEFGTNLTVRLARHLLSESTIINRHQLPKWHIPYSSY